MTRTLTTLAALATFTFAFAAGCTGNATDVDVAHEAITIGERSFEATSFRDAQTGELIEVEVAYVDGESEEVVTVTGPLHDESGELTPDAMRMADLMSRVHPEIMEQLRTMADSAPAPEHREPTSGSVSVIRLVLGFTSPLPGDANLRVDFAVCPDGTGLYDCAQRWRR